MVWGIATPSLPEGQLLVPASMTPAPACAWRSSHVRVVILAALGLANVGFHQRHQFCHGINLLQIPDGIFDSSAAPRWSAHLGECGEFFFNIRIREWIAWITFGKIQLFIERASVSCIDMHDYPL